MTTYSNPRMKAIVGDWPMGRERGTAYFVIEQHPDGRERAVRATKAPGGMNKPKKLTYAHRMRIVDGDDGRTYIAARNSSGTVVIWRGTMDVCAEHVFAGDPRYDELMELFAS